MRWLQWLKAPGLCLALAACGGGDDQAVADDIPPLYPVKITFTFQPYAQGDVVTSAVIEGPFWPEFKAYPPDFSGTVFLFAGTYALSLRASNDVIGIYSCYQKFSVPEDTEAACHVKH